MLRTSALVPAVVALAGTGLYRIGVRSIFSGRTASRPTCATSRFITLFERNVEWLFVLGLLGLATDRHRCGRTVQAVRVRRLQRWLLARRHQRARAAGDRLVAASWLTSAACTIVIPGRSSYWRARWT
jgi:hypothetical protein